MTARLVALLTCALGVAGCGLGPGERATGVSLVVTRDFGSVTLGEFSDRETPGDETVMRLLKREFPDTKTRYGGNFVQSIKGVSGGRRGSRRVDWFFYVNGVEARTGAAEVKVEAGDRILWDHHDWGAAQTIPAIVGAFPEPFLSGEEGKRYPTRVDCGKTSREACDIVTAKLGAAGIRQVSLAGIPGSTGKKTLRLVVGPWTEVRRDPVAARIDNGPGVTGIYARFNRAGDRLTLLDPAGEDAETYGPGTGFIAATRVGEQQPTWIVTGTDTAGVKAAAEALEEGGLAEKFAVAISAGRAHPAPVVAPTEAAAR